MSGRTGCFVTATDTGVGKTVVAAAIAAALRSQGVAVAAFKPVLTGADEPTDPDWPHDDAILAAAAGIPREAVTPFRLGPPASPHLAAELDAAADRATAAGAAGGATEAASSVAALDPARLRAAFAAAAATGDAVVVEGVGGLLVPLTRDYLVRDFARDVRLPLVIAARPGLGTINHTLLTLAAARAAGLTVAGVVLTPWPAAPSTIEADNRATIARLGDVEVVTLPRIRRADPALLTAAGATLPLERWLTHNDTRPARGTPGA